MANEDKATRYHRLQRRASILATILTAAVLLILLVTGASAGIRDLVSDWFGSSFIFTIVGYVVLLGLVLELVGLPLAFYRGVTLERRYGLSTQTTARWWIDHLKAGGISMVFAAIAALIVLSLIRWDPERPARVITGAALDMVLHPYESRTITHREAARVMGFPDDWRILPLRGVSNLRATWGKGITVQCGKWIGEQVKNALDGNPGSVTGVPDGDREWFIRQR